jgi:hypothetical protein
LANIKEIFKQLLNDNEEIYTISGKVTDINEGKRVCRVEPLDGSAAIFNARLQASVGFSEGLVFFPRKGSTVSVSFFDRDFGYIAQTDDVEKVALKIGGLEVLVDSENIKSTVKTHKTTAQAYDLAARTAKFTAVELLQLTAPNIALNGAVIIGGSIALNGGALGGVPTAGGVADKINELADDLNELKAVFSAWSPSGSDGGAALKASIGAYSAKSIEPADPDDIGNPKFKQ